MQEPCVTAGFLNNNGEYHGGTDGYYRHHRDYRDHRHHRNYRHNRDHRHYRHYRDHGHHRDYRDHRHYGHHRNYRHFRTDRHYRHHRDYRHQRCHWDRPVDDHRPRRSDQHPRRHCRPLGSSHRIPEIPHLCQDGKSGLYPADIRARIIDNVLNSTMAFAGDPATETLSLVYGAASGANALVSLRRPGQSAFVNQLSLVESYAALRPDRAHEIIPQIMLPLNFFSSIAWLDEARTPRTLELLMAAWRFCVNVHMQFKFAFACPRPIEYSPQIQPIINTPQHGVLPSGHATESFMLAHVLTEIAKASKGKQYKSPLFADQMMQLANRIATNRVIAGVHFPIDNMAGATLGLTLAQYFVACCSSATHKLNAWEFDGTAFNDASKPPQDFVWEHFHDAIIKGDKTKHPGLSKIAQGQAGNLPKDEPLRWMWEQAIKEWH